MFGKVPRHYSVLAIAVLSLILLFVFSEIALMDDGISYARFTRTLAEEGRMDFVNNTGAMGLPFLSIPIYLLTGSDNSIVYTSMILAILSIPLIFCVTKKLFDSERAGVYAVLLFLLMPAPYVSLLRGLVETATVFSILLFLYFLLKKSRLTPVVYCLSCIVKPFNFCLLPLFLRDFLSKKKILFLAASALIGLGYLTINYMQTGEILHAFVPASEIIYENRIPEFAENFHFELRNFLSIISHLFAPEHGAAIAPIVIVIGIYGIFKKQRKWLWVIAINIIFVSLLAASLPKYLLPTIVLSLIFAAELISRHIKLFPLVLVNSVSVFLYINETSSALYWSKGEVWFLLTFVAVILAWIFYEKDQLISSLKNGISKNTQA